MNDVPQINYNDFLKIDIRIGEIQSAEKIPNTDRLLKLKVSFGEDELRQIVSGIAEYFPDVNQLIGKQCAFVVNLEPKIIKEHESNGMILAISGENGIFALLVPNKIVSAGSKVG